MARGEKRKTQQKLKRWAREEKEFNADLNALLLKHKATIQANSYGDHHYGSTVTLDVHIGNQMFNIGEGEWDTITVNGIEPSATEE